MKIVSAVVVVVIVVTLGLVLTQCGDKTPVKPGAPSSYEKGD